MSWLRATVAVAGSLLAGLATVGCGVAFLFEVDGFGGDRNAGPQPLVLGGYAALAVGCVVATALLWRWLVPQAWGWGMGTYFASVALAVVYLGFV